jgi:transcriptional regulator GlxA family with amidase domain
MFKKSCNTSPIRYLLEYRIAMAKQLLISTQLTLTEVAEKTGFRDTNYFIKQFGTIAGISPMKFRIQEHGLLHYPDHTPATLPEVGSRIFVN